MHISKTIPYSALLASFALSGCASPHHNPKDPFESFNRGVYKLNDAVDKAVAKPAAKGYQMVVPPPARMMLSNFFSNLNDVIVAANDLLQFKLVRAASDTGRVVVNTTVGMFGLVDVATAVGLEKHNEDFGQTLGRWGIGSGPYLVLPVLGPSSVRDGLGLVVDSSASQMRKIKRVDTRNQAYLVNLVGRRAALLEQERTLEEAALDRYAFIRDAYLQHRQSQVYDGNPPRKKYEDEDEEDDKPAKPPASGKESNARPSAAAVPVAAQTLPTVPQLAEAGVELSPPQSPPAVCHIWVSQSPELR